MFGYAGAAKGPKLSEELAARKHVPALDGLRGIAIVSVFLFHYGGGARSASPVVRVLDTVRQAGWMGVDLFFVLSGFLITGILFDSKNRPNYFRNFYARRALRIFPLFYGVAAVLLALTPLLKCHWRLGHLAYLFYAANVANYVDPSLNGPSPYFSFYHLWSLAVEEQFYLIWPFVVLAAPGRTALLRICLGLILAAPVIRVALAASGLVNPSFLYMETICRMDSLALGGLFAMLIRGPLLSIPRCLPAALTSLGAFATGLIALHERQFASGTPWMSTLGFTTIAIGCSGLLLGAFRPGTFVHRLTSLAILRRIGTYSYGIYVYHALLEPLCRTEFRKIQDVMKSQSAAGALYMLGSFLFVFSVAAVSYECFEKPVMRYKAGF